VRENKKASKLKNITFRKKTNPTIVEIKNKNYKKLQREGKKMEIE